MWVALAVGAVVAGLIADGVLRLVAGATSFSVGPAGGVAASISVLVAAVFCYQALLHWNRVSTQIADPGDWLNGLSAVLTIVGLGNLVVLWTSSSLEQWPWWQLQPFLFRVAALIVLLGTTLTTAQLGGRLSDLRLSVISACWVLVLVGETADAVSAGGRTIYSRAGWLLALVVLGVCTVRRPTAGRPQAATTQAPTIGALVVLLASVAVLVLDGGRHGQLARLSTAYAVLAVLGVSARILQLIRDLAQLAQTRHEAMTDDLTGVANRRALMAAVDHAVEHRGVIALVAVDLNRFKAVNGRYGHAVGDAFLRRLASRLREELPPDALLARLGGDEFSVLLRGEDVRDVQTVARSLLTAASATVEIAGRRLRVGASIGVVISSGQDADGEELLRRADVAMYVSKGSGGGISVYDGVADAAARERGRRVEELRFILDTRAPARAAAQLVVHYQPQLDVRTGRVVGAEALVRWQHRELGLLGPDAFIELAEEHGLMPGLTGHVLRHATTQAMLWRAAGHRLRVAVNLSTSALSDPDFLPLLDDILATTRIDPTTLILEITETTLMSSPEQALQTTHAIAARGVGISIDDYGTGYSSLAYLNDLPATELKLDRSFTSRAVTDERTAAIVGATIELAHSLGLRLVAEGVEDEPTLRALRQLGCDETQGYLHSRPLTPDDFSRWLARLADLPDTTRGPWTASSAPGAHHVAPAPVARA